MNNWHAVKKEAVFKELRTSEEGLSQKEADLRLERNGKNIIEEKDQLNALRIFFIQFKSWLVYILLFCVIIAVVIAHYLDASVIGAIIMLNVVIGFVQQYKAEKSVKELKKLLVLKTKVLRDGVLKIINAEDIVTGDIVLLRSGDKIPADCRIFRYENLEVDESVLTGESMSIEKTDEPLSKDAILTERKNMLYAGTHIDKGNCRAIVVSTAMDTEFGKITGMLEKIREEETPMQKKMDKFAKKISLYVLIPVVLLFVIGIVSGYEKYQMLLTAIALAISAIPEGLPAVITIGLAFASKKMAQRNVIIKKLSASESLGSVTVICTDKTGTITEGKMRVMEVYCNERSFIKKEDSLFLDGKKINIKNEKDIEQIIKTSVLCNNARFENREDGNGYEIIGDPTESALVLNALELGFNKKLLTEGEKRVREFPFSSERKMMSIIRKNNEKIVYSKGGPEVILKRSHFELFNGRKIRLTDSKREQLIKEAERMQRSSLRVLAFAFKTHDEAGDAEQNLVFIGFIGMHDPPRKEVKNAVDLCKKAGIKVKMITGDAGITARAIANQVGITGEMIDGKRLDSMTDEELLKKIDSINIFARIEPKQKFRIVEILKIKGEEVAVTGDGVNDVLALKKADIGIAMGIRGSDVAREVSDMVLIDDNFASIVNAVEEGRIVYNNIKKATKFLISVNFSEILLICFTVILSLPLPFTPLQILWMNLITDSIPAIAITKEKGENVMSEKPKKEKNILDKIFLFIIVAGVITFLAELSLFLLTLGKYDINEVRTMIVTEDVLFELFFVFICRNSKIFGKDGARSNKFIFYGVLISIAVHIIAVYTFAGKLFDFTFLTSSQWMLILPFSLSGLVIFGVGRWLMKKRKK
jgi:Ca2+-transporting ATPase